MLRFDTSFISAILMAAIVSPDSGVLARHSHRRDDKPTLVQCQGVSLSWAQGVAPYNATIIDGQTQKVVDTLVSQDDNSLVWPVTAEAGTSVSFIVQDATGTASAGGPFSVVAGTDTSCLNSGSGSPPNSSASPSGSSSIESSPAPSQADPSTTSPTTASPSPTSRPSLLDGLLPRQGTGLRHIRLGLASAPSSPAPLLAARRRSVWGSRTTQGKRASHAKRSSPSPALPIAV